LGGYERVFKMGVGGGDEIIAMNIYESIVPAIKRVRRWNTCCIHIDAELYKVFRDKGELYRYLNELCRPIDDAELSAAASILRLKVSQALDKFDGVAQVVIAVRSRKISTSLAIVFDGRSRVFHILTDNLVNCPDIDCAVQTIATYIAKVLDLRELYEMRLQYGLGNERVVLKSRCMFDANVLEVVLLNAIFLAFFISSSHILQS